MERIWDGNVVKSRVTSPLMFQKGKEMISPRNVVVTNDICLVIPPLYKILMKTRVTSS